MIVKYVNKKDPKSNYSIPYYELAKFARAFRCDPRLSKTEFTEYLAEETGSMPRMLEVEIAAVKTAMELNRRGDRKVNWGAKIYTPPNEGSAYPPTHVDAAVATLMEDAEAACMNNYTGPSFKNYNSRGGFPAADYILRAMAAAFSQLGRA